MSKTNKIFESVPVQIPDRSGFDLSHEVLTTAKCGTVVPITHFEVLPGDTISMGSMLKVTLPPFAVPFMGRIDAELTAAFIPNRLLWAGWQSFITNNNGISTATNTAPFSYGPDGSLVPNVVTGYNNSNAPVRVPVIRTLAASNSQPYLGPGTLANYLGIRDYNESVLAVNALPFLAYHKFCDDWIRAEEVMKPFFPKMFANNYTVGNLEGTGSQSGSGAASTYYSEGRFAPFVSEPSLFLSNPNPSNEFNLYPTSYSADSASTTLPFDTSISLGSLRQRCWAKDYFTTATTRPQAGAEAQVTFSVDNDVATTSGFTIATLRAANSLQKWLERNNIAGTEYGSQILAHFGVTPPDAVLNRSVLLGSIRQPVVVGSVENTAGVGDTAMNGTKSPYGNVLGAAAGFGSSFDKGSLIDNFTAKEHGYIMVFFTLIPHSYYNGGIDRSLLHRYLGDYAWPEFAGIGDQPIFDGELSSYSTDPLGTFAYQQRYVEYKHKLDVVSGYLRDGENMDVYALQRGFSSRPSLGKSFLEIPTDYLDQVLGVSAAVSGFGCMIDAYFDCKALRVLPEYSLPHL